MICRHCQVRKVVRPRGLCWPCYTNPEISTLYPSTFKKCRRGSGQANTLKLPDAPTRCPPGTFCKAWVMTQRALRGEALNHPGDATLSLD